MKTLVRVPTARFKYNMAPFVEQAKAGAKVIVTNNGTDEFEVVPCETPRLTKAEALQVLEASEVRFTSNWDKLKAETR